MAEQAFLKSLQAKLWTSSNKLLPSLDAAVYKHVVLGMIFLKYVSDSFETRRQELITAFANPEHDYYLGEDAEEDSIKDELENRDYYTEKNVIWVPKAARWDYLQNNIRLSLGTPLPLGGELKGTGNLIDDAMSSIEDKFSWLEKMIEQSKPIEDTRIFLNAVCDLFFGDFDILYSATCIFYTTAVRISMMILRWLLVFTPIKLRV